MPTPITRANIDALLDAGAIEAAMTSGRWWRIRRNGATRRWKRDADRIRVPIKCGFRTCGAIVEHDFLVDGTLDTDHYRVAVD